jgi:hypothetical protein
LKKHLLISIFGICFLVQCQNSNYKKNELLTKNLNESVWVQKVTEECYNSITFTRTDSIQIYSCEIGEKYYGTYKISNDTLICQITKAEFDYEFPENSRHRLKPYKTEILYSNSELTELNEQKSKYVRK